MTDPLDEIRAKWGIETQSPPPSIPEEVASEEGIDPLDEIRSKWGIEKTPAPARLMDQPTAPPVEGDDYLTDLEDVEWPQFRESTEDETLDVAPGELGIPQSMWSKIPGAIAESVPGLLKQYGGGMLRAGAEQAVAREAALPESYKEMEYAIEAPSPQIVGQQQERGKELYRQGTEEIAAARPEGMRPVEEFGYDLGMMLTQMIPVLAIGAATGGSELAALTPMAYQVYTQRYGQLREEGRDPELAHQSALFSTGSEVLTEFVPLKFLFKAGTPALKRVLQMTVGEGLQESLSSILESMWAAGKLKEDITLGEALRAAGYEGLLGGFGGAVMGAGGAVTHDIIDRTQRTIMQHQNTAALKDIAAAYGTTVEELLDTELLKNNPEIVSTIYETVIKPYQRAVDQLAEAERKIEELDIGEESDSDPLPWQVETDQHGRVKSRPHRFDLDPSGSTRRQNALDYLDGIDADGNPRELKDLNGGALLIPQPEAELEDKVVAVQTKLAEMEAAGETNTPAYENLKVQLLKNKHKVFQVRSLEGKISAFLDQVTKRFFRPGVRFVYSTNDVHDVLSKKLLDIESSGVKLPNRAVPEGLGSAMGHLNMLDENTYLVQLSKERVFFAESNPLDPKIQKEVVDENAVYSFLAHEVGHAIIFDAYKSLPPRLQRAMWRDYKKWLEQNISDLISENEAEWARSSGGAYLVEKKRAREGRRATRGEQKEDLFRKAHLTGGDLFTRRKAGTTIRAQDLLRYYYSPAEYAANQIMKLGEKPGTKLNELGEGFFKKVARKLRLFYRMFGQEVMKPAESFEVFLDYVASKKLVNQRDTLLKEMLSQPSAEDVEIKALEAQMDTLLNLLGSEGLLSENTPQKDMKEALDKYGKLAKYGYTLLQLVKENQHVVGLPQYLEAVRAYHRTKMRWVERADRRLKQWTDLFKSDAKRKAFANFVYEVTLTSDEKARRLKPGELQGLAEKHGLTEIEASFYENEIRKDFEAALSQLERLEIERLKVKFSKNPIALDEAKKETEKTFADMRNRDYFPLSRFGQFTVMVKLEGPRQIEGKKYQAGDTVLYEHYQLESERDERVKYLRKHYGKTEVKMDTLSEEYDIYSVIPPQLLEKLADRIGLTAPENAELYERLREEIYRSAPGQAYTKHRLHREGVPGFSTDAMRTYGQYFQRFSNFIAKLEHGGAMQSAIDTVEKSAELIHEQGGNNKKRRGIVDWLKLHKQYLFNPGNELAEYRAVGFLWYMAFVPKSAVVNLTQVPLVTGPYLATRYGDVASTRAISKAIGKTMRMWKQKGVLTTDEARMLEALSDILDESFATDLAAVAEGSLLTRITGARLAGSERVAHAVRGLAHGGAYLFHKAEKANRRITALAAFDLAKKNGMTTSMAIEKAREAVEATQFEYARFNRPRFMRGKKSAFFLFWQYLQNMMFFVWKDPGRWKYLLGLFLLAGLEGLPGAEDILDLFDFLATKLKEQLKMKNPKVDARRTIREMLDGIWGGPDWVMHGLSRLSPFDISGSISMGRLVPGIEPIFGQVGDFNSRLLAAQEDAGGALISIPYRMLKAAASDDPNVIKRFEWALPTELGNILRAYRYGTEGETLSDGSQPSAFRFSDGVEKTAATIGMALGFRPTAIAQEREKLGMAKEVVMYYEARKRMIMRDLGLAIANRDADAQRVIRDEITQYNNDVPYPTMRITFNSAYQSVMQRMTKMQLQGMDVGPEKRTMQLYRELDELF